MAISPVFWVALPRARNLTKTCRRGERKDMRNSGMFYARRIIRNSGRNPCGCLPVPAGDSARGYETLPGSGKKQADLPGPDFGPMLSTIRFLLKYL